MAHGALLKCLDPKVLESVQLCCYEEWSWSPQPTNGTVLGATRKAVVLVLKMYKNPYIHWWFLLTRWYHLNQICWRWLEKVKTCRFSDSPDKNGKSGGIHEKTYQQMLGFVDFHLRNSMLKHQLANNANGTSNAYFTFHHLESIWNDEPGTDFYPSKNSRWFSEELTPRKPAIRSIHLWNHKSAKRLCLQ